MNFLSTTEIRSKLYPEVKLKVRIVTVGGRIDFVRNQRETNGDVEWHRNTRALWNTLVLDFDGLMIDDKKPSVADFFLNGPEELVDELVLELLRMTNSLDKTDTADEAQIVAAREQIAAAEARIAARKNSGPQSSGNIAAEVATPTAANATATEKSESDEIAMAAPI